MILKARLPGDWINAEIIDGQLYLRENQTVIVLDARELQSFLNRELAPPEIRAWSDELLGIEEMARKIDSDLHKDFRKFMTRCSESIRADTLFAVVADREPEKCAKYIIAFLEEVTFLEKLGGRSDAGALRVKNIDDVYSISLPSKDHPDTLCVGIRYELAGCIRDGTRHIGRVPCEAHIHIHRGGDIQILDTKAITSEAQ